MNRDVFFIVYTDPLCVVRRPEIYIIEIKLLIQTLPQKHTTIQVYSILHSTRLLYTHKKLSINHSLVDLTRFTLM